MRHTAELSAAPSSARRRRTRIAAPIGVALALALGAASVAQADGGSGDQGLGPAPAAASSLTGPVGHEGRWLTDAHGRVLMLTGVNMVAKGALTPDGRGFGADDADFLVENGFEAVRLGLSPDAFMPTPGQVDQAYLASYAQTVKTLTDRGLLVLVDLHQDGWGPAVCGNGFPAWMTITHGAENTCTTFPLYYVTNPAIQAAFQSFWDNEAGPDGVGLQDQVATMFGALAGAVGHDDGVLGYDVLNEPWPGTTWQPCAVAPGCPDLDAAGLDEFHAKATTAIRAKDPTHIVFGEPYVLFNFGGAGTSIAKPGNDPRAGLSFHIYTVDPSLEPNVVANAVDWSDRTGGALLTTEFGATNDPAVIERQIGVVEDGLVPWMWWSYDENVVHDIRQAPTGDNVNGPVLGALVRPHLVAVAGTPTGQDFDRATRVLRASWSTTAPGATRRGTTGDTLIRVPKLTYDEGYEVDVDGGAVVSEPGSTQLLVRAGADVDRVSVVVRPASTNTPTTSIPLQTASTTTSTSTSLPVASTSTSAPPPSASTTSPDSPSTSGLVSEGNGGPAGPPAVSGGGSDGTLARTGSDVGTALLVALVLMVVGGTLVLRSRRFSTR
ncbi:MAG: cellulase family glycosylhydrolase [Actinobacteria bacterium]|nr:cellulase family glycosylhydrolase [Actinomycetota bacterium]